jgi:hypothetical protein
VNDQHVLALVETVHGANFYAIQVFALDAIFNDDIGHPELRPKAAMLPYRIDK